MLSTIRRDLPISPPIEGRFLSILMDATSACNLVCRMCPQSVPLAEGLDKRPVMLGTEALRRIAEEIVPHAASINLSCIAEPFVHPHFRDFLQMLEGKIPPASSIVTNGMILPDDLIDSICRAGVGTMTFSLDSPKKEVFEWIRRGADFGRIVGNIRRLTEYKRQRGLATPSIQINCVLMKRNIRDVPDLVALAAELGAGEIHLRHLLRVEGLEAELAAETLFDDQELADSCLGKAMEAAQRVGIRLPTLPFFRQPEQGGAGNAAPWTHRARKSLRTFVRTRFGLPRCVQPWNNLTIHPNGEVFPCCNWIYDPSTRRAQVFFPPRKGHSSRAEQYCVGNINTQSFREIWEGPVYKRVRGELMGKAPMLDLCAGCPLRLGQGENLYDPQREMVDVVRTRSKT